MNKIEEIKLMLDESKAKTSALQEEYERLVAEEEKRQSYHINHVEPEYIMNWEGYAHDLERELLCLSREDMSGKIEKAMLRAQKNNSVEIPVDNKKVYTCPVCGRSNTLDVGTWGSVFSNSGVKYAVFCNRCDFECPYPCDDYDEAWEVFKQWLRDENYI